MAFSASIILGAFYYVALPFIWLFQVIAYLLATIALPFLQIGSYLLYLSNIPLRFLARFETLYIYFGIAFLVGVVAGAAIHYIAKFLASILGIDIASEQRGREKTRTAASYRADREKRAEKKEKRLKPKFAPSSLHSKLDDAPLEEYSDWMRIKRDSPKLKSPVGLASTTIIEEEDSTDDEFL